MKYDLLEGFKEYLYEQCTPNTARTYYAAIVKLFRNIQFNSFSELSPEWLLQEAKKKFRTKNEFSAVKNALKRLWEYDSTLSIPKESDFRAISIKKRNYSKRPPKVIYLHPTLRKINQLSDTKFKLAYRVALVSGLRVSELSDLEASDFTYDSDLGRFVIEVRNGKGGHGGIVECSSDSYLAEHLPGYLETHPEGKLFYSEAYMRKRAGALGIECHDLRRIFAIQTREKLKKEMPMEEANQIVMQQLRHVRFSTTKRYLFNRKLKFEYEKEKKEVE